MSVGSFLEPCNIPDRYRPKGYILGASKKNLLHVFGSEDDDASHYETIKVYLRLKPLHGHHERLDLMEVLDSHTLLVKSTSDDLTRRKTPNCKYTFSKIFDTKTSQKELFTECVNPLVRHFLDGRNCLLFSFGTTSAGKTFTIQGTGEQPGIIPRVLTMTFKSITSKLGTSNTLCPYRVISAIELTKNNLIEIDDLKNRILCWNKNDSVPSNLHGSSEDLYGSQKFFEMQQLLHSEVQGIKCDIDDNYEMLVWVSFIEIYNERIFDLLDPCERGKKRNELKLAQDSDKNNYVKGVRYIPVKSETEAYKVMLYGKHNLQIESTNLNTSSSRSHSIFTIKLLKYSKLNQDFIIVSSFSICDLAGSERQKKTLNEADRLKESQCINSSLHVLNRCFSIIRENQCRNEKRLIPYRESKLTQLFKRALSGFEIMTMIVNVSLSKMLYEESQNTLKTSAIAHQIIVQPRPKVKQSVARSSRFSQLARKRNGGELILWEFSDKSDTSGERYDSCDSKITVESSQIQKLEEDVETLLGVIDTLKKMLKTKKDQLREERRKNFVLESNLRKQLTSEFQKILDRTEMQYREQLQYMTEMINETDKKAFGFTIEALRTRKSSHEETTKKRKRCNTEGSYEMCTDNTLISDKIQPLQDEIEQLKEVIEDYEEDSEELQKKITSLTDVLEATKREKMEMCEQINDLKFQNGLLQNENKKLKATSEALKSDNTEALCDQITQLKEIIKNQVELLEEARLDIAQETKEKEEAKSEITSLEMQLEEKDIVIDKLTTDLESTKHLLSLQIEENESLEDRLEKYNEMDELNKKLQKEIENLKKELSTMTGELKSAEANIKNQEDVRLQLALSVSDSNCKDLQISDLEREIKTLHNELKQEIQRNAEFKNIGYNAEDLKKLKEQMAVKEEELKTSKHLINELQESITYKDKKLECKQNKLEAFEQTASIVTAYKDEVDKKHKELDEARELSTRQAATITNLNNQKMINSKYDEQLRKCKEDVEREKREAARLRETWIKLTPTPKSKEEYIKRLEQQVESLTKSEKYEKKNRSSCNCNQENKTVRKPKAAKSLMPKGVCTRSMKVSSVDDGIEPLSYSTSLQTKSTQKKGRQQNPLSPVSLNCDPKWSDYKSEHSLIESSKKTRRKLYNNNDQLKTNDGDTEQIEEMPFTFHQSPNSVIKCNLRQKSNFPS